MIITIFFVFFVLFTLLLAVVIFALSVGAVDDEKLSAEMTNLWTAISSRFRR